MADRLRIAILAPGEMGAGVAARLTQNGATVVAVLTGRSNASVERARAANMQAVELSDLAEVDLILSIVPPSEALALAEQIAAVLRVVRNPATYADCNAIAPATVERVAAIVETAGARFVDAGIIGRAPRGATYSPAIYASGPNASDLIGLRALGLDIRILDGPVGQASALKMAFGAMSKGIQAVGLSAMLGAVEAGVAAPFIEALSETQPEFLAHFRERTPSVFGKAYRWVSEMEEVAAFLGGGGEQLFTGAARQFERIAQDEKTGGADKAAVLALLRRKSPS